MQRLERVSGIIKLIDQKQHAKHSQRRADVYKHVSQYLEDLKRLCEKEREAIWREECLLQESMAKEEDVCMKIKAVAEKAGIREVDNVRDIERAAGELLDSMGSI